MKDDSLKNHAFIKTPLSCRSIYRAVCGPVLAINPALDQIAIKS